MPKMTFEGDTHEEMIEAIINSGVAFFNQKQQALMRQQMEEAQAAQAADKEKDETPEEESS